MESEIETTVEMKTQMKATNVIKIAMEELHGIEFALNSANEMESNSVMEA